MKISFVEDLTLKERSFVVRPRSGVKLKTQIQWNLIDDVGY